jgi:peptide chain release factor subunit 1
METSEQEEQEIEMWKIRKVRAPAASASPLALARSRGGAEKKRSRTLFPPSPRPPFPGAGPLTHAPPLPRLLAQLVKGLTEARGNGTSMISLVIPPKGQVNLVNKMLTDEAGTASNIKSRVNRQSVLDAIGSTQTRLKRYSSVPPNGLVIFCGTILTDEGKEKKLNIDFEPFKPINTSLYLCDNKFHTEALSELLQSDNKYGFIVMDGHGTLFGTLAGNHREVIHKVSVDLPKKHGRGGQSALRFARLRLEKRQNYVRKIAELTTQHFITNDKPNVNGLVLAGSADFKNQLTQSDLFDIRLQPIILMIVDVSYGGENGFNQAIELSADTLGNVKFVKEKKLIGKYFDEISQDSGRYCFGVKDTLMCLEMGAVEMLVVWENLEVNRHVLVNNQTGDEQIAYLTPEQERDDANFKDGRGAREHGERLDAGVAGERVQEVRVQPRVRHRPIGGGVAVRPGVRRHRRDPEVPSQPGGVRGGERRGQRRQLQLLGRRGVHLRGAEG